MLQPHEMTIANFIWEISEGERKVENVRRVMAENPAGSLDAAWHLIANGPHIKSSDVKEFFFEYDLNPTDREIDLLMKQIGRQVPGYITRQEFDAKITPNELLRQHALLSRSPTRHIPLSFPYQVLRCLEEELWFTRKIEERKEDLEKNGIYVDLILSSLSSNSTVTEQNLKMFMRRCGIIICDEDLPGVFRRISGNTVITLDDLKEFLVPINPVFSGKSAIYPIPNNRRSFSSSYTTTKKYDYSPSPTKPSQSPLRVSQLSQSQRFKKVRIDSTPVKYSPVSTNFESPPSNFQKISPISSAFSSNSRHNYSTKESFELLRIPQETSEISKTEYQTFAKLLKQRSEIQEKLSKKREALRSCLYSMMLFQYFDTDSNGSLLLPDLERGCKGLGIMVQRRDLQKLLDRYDTSGRGKFSYFDFKLMILGECRETNRHQKRQITAEAKNLIIDLFKALIDAESEIESQNLALPITSIEAIAKDIGQANWITAANINTIFQKSDEFLPDDKIHQIYKSLGFRKVTRIPEFVREFKAK